MPEKNLLGPNSSDCPTRVLLDQVAEKWAVLVLLAAAAAPIRFNTLKRSVEASRMVQARDEPPDANDRPHTIGYLQSDGRRQPPPQTA